MPLTEKAPKDGESHSEGHGSYPGKGRVASSVGESEEERIWQILI